MSKTILFILSQLLTLPEQLLVSLTLQKFLKSESPSRFPVFKLLEERERDSKIRIAM